MQDLKIKNIRINPELRGRTVCGYASKWNLVDSDSDRIMPGAFTKTIRENGPEGAGRIVFLLQHDKKLPLGKPTCMREDTIGLYVEAPIVETSYGNDAIALVKSGVLDGLSIGFNPVKQRTQGSINNILEVSLMEYSLVTWPALDEARITDVKSLLVSAIDRKDTREIEKLLAGISDTDAIFSDAVFANEILEAAENVYGNKNRFIDMAVKQQPDLFKNLENSTIAREFAAELKNIANKY